MGSLEALLALQEIDTALDQLRHRRETLPERTELVESEATRAATESERDAIFAQLSEVRHAEKAAEDEATSVEAKAAEVERMLYGGTVTAAKELEAYQADLAMLKARQRTLEDSAIELLETAEPLEAELSSCRERLDAVVFPQTAPAIVVLAVGWAAMFPLLMWLSQRYDGFAGNVKPSLEAG